MRQTSSETEAKVVSYFEDNPDESLRQAVKILKIKRKRIRKILKINNIETVTQRKNRLITKRLYAPQPYLDIRGVYLGRDFQIIVLVTRGIEISKKDIERFIQTPVSDLAAASYLSGDHLNMAEFIHKLALVSG